MTEPIAGPRFKAAAALCIDRTDRKLLALIGAYRDAELHPTIAELGDRLQMTPSEIDERLGWLSRRRLIWIDWAPYHRHRTNTYPQLRRKRNRYTCLWAGEPLPQHASDYVTNRRTNRQEKRNDYHDTTATQLRRKSNE